LPFDEIENTHGTSINRQDAKHARGYPQITQISQIQNEGRGVVFLPLPLGEGVSAPFCRLSPNPLPKGGEKARISNSFDRVFC
jgi:hypothetical protein